MPIPVVADYTVTLSPPGSTATVRQLSLPKPDGVQVGDLLLLIGANDSDAAPAWGTKAGWTRAVHTGGSNPDASLVMYWRVADGTEGATEIIDGGVVMDMIGWYVRVTGADPTTPIHALGTPTVQGSQASIALAGVTTTVPDCLAMYGVAFDGGDSDPWSVAGAGWSQTEYQETFYTSANSGAVAAAWGQRSMPDAGATGTVTISWGLNNDGACGAQWVIQGAAGGATTHELAGTLALLAPTAAGGLAVQAKLTGSLAAGSPAATAGLGVAHGLAGAPTIPAHGATAGLTARARLQAATALGGSAATATLAHRGALQTEAAATAAMAHGQLVAQALLAADCALAGLNADAMLATSGGVTLRALAASLALSAQNALAPLHADARLGVASEQTPWGASAALVLSHPLAVGGVLTSPGADTSLVGRMPLAADLDVLPWELEAALEDVTGRYTGVPHRARVWQLAGESRVYQVAGESRVYQVAGEHRGCQVPAEQRSFQVLAERRTYTVEE